MNKIAIVGCDASGKTVFVSALTEYYKAGQRAGQACALVSADTATRRYTADLHHTMRILHEWPAATNTTETKVLRWSMVKDGKQWFEIGMMDYAGENYRQAFRDDGTVRNQESVEALVEYIGEADFIVITVGLDNMVRSLTPEVYRDMENGREAHDRDSEAQWITHGLLRLVRAKLNSDPPGVVLALTQADKHRDLLAEYGGAKGLFGKCWAEIDMTHPDLNVVAVASVDKLTAGGFPADDYKTDGVLAVMKEFSRYAFGDCDAIAAELMQRQERLSNFTPVISPSGFHEAMMDFENGLCGLREMTAMVEELYKEDFPAKEKFLEQCRLFWGRIEEIENLPLEARPDAEHWETIAGSFPELAGTIQGFRNYYLRMAEQIREEGRIREQERQESLRREEEERQRMELERRREEEKRRREEEEERRRLELELIKAEAERTKFENAAMERREKIRSACLKLLTAGAVVFLLAVVLGVYRFHEQKLHRAEREALEKLKSEERERIAVKTAADRAKKAEMDAIRAREWAEGEKAKSAAEAARAVAEAEAERRRYAEEETRRLKAESERLAMEQERRMADSLEAERRRKESTLEDLRRELSGDNLVPAREGIAKLRRMALTKREASEVEFAEAFCDRLERANNGDAESMAWIALQHAEQKTCVRQDRENAANWYRKAADAGNADAMYELAWWAEKGIGGEVNESEALRRYRMAARLNHGNAMYRLGIIYAEGRMGIAKSLEDAHIFFTYAKKHGCTFNDAKTGVDAWIEATREK